jgi:hypothetical protein
MFKKIITFGTSLLSLCTMTSVMVHDTQVYRLASSTVAASAATVRQGKLSSTSDLGVVAETHPHPEKQNTTLRGFTYEAPSFPAREQRLKRFLLQNVEPRGRHAFDNEFLPLLQD